MRSIRDIVLHNKTVFLRVDFNVPLNDKGEITDDTRIKAALTTIEYIREKGSKLVIASHLGRPKGAVVESMRMRPVAQRLHELLGVSVQYVEDCVGPHAEREKKALQPGDVLLLENLRFYAQEEDNDMHFAEQLAQGIDVYITEAFGTIHRKHASTFALPSLVFDKGIGFLMQEEVDALDRIVHNPKKPFVVVIGGVKISDKVAVIRNLAPMADVVLVGGGVANTFLKGEGVNVGASIVDNDSVAHDIAEQFKSVEPTIRVTLPGGAKLSKIQTPLDFVAAPNTTPGAETRVVELGKDEVPEGWMFLDIGPKTQQLYADVLAKAQTIFWNGPMGLFEQDAYAGGSRAVAQAIADSKGYAVLGGGDTEVVVEKFGLQGKFSHVSTGGGASLTYLAQEPLPGLEALE